MDGGFVERCLWKPDLRFKDLNDLDIIRPTPTSGHGSPITMVLGINGTVTAIMRNVHITVSCYMDFDGYPFDQQVQKMSFKISRFKHSSNLLSFNI